MKNKKALLTFTLILIICVTCIFNVFAHKGRTDANGGHRDNNNQSGLGSYHYHCGGYPAHLHNNGVCPYTSYSSSGYTSSSDEYDEGYSDGYDDGYNDGYNESYDQVYDNGYDDGYDDGYSERYDESLDDLEELEKLQKIKEENSTTIFSLLTIIILYLVYKAVKFMRNK